jgi:Ni/Fe-hydrogenase 1 B-type cytochrome subunit
MWHDLFAWGFVLFVILHVYIVFLDARNYHNGLISGMITGHKFRQLEGEDDGE